LTKNKRIKGLNWIKIEIYDQFSQNCTIENPKTEIIKSANIEGLLNVIKSLIEKNLWKLVEVGQE
jgi:hypothetical protein